MVPSKHWGDTHQVSLVFTWEVSIGHHWQVTRSTGVADLQRRERRSTPLCVKQPHDVTLTFHYHSLTLWGTSVTCMLAIIYVCSFLIPHGRFNSISCVHAWIAVVTSTQQPCSNVPSHQTMCLWAHDSVLHSDWSYSVRPQKALRNKFLRRTLDKIHIHVRGHRLELSDGEDVEGMVYSSNGRVLQSSV